MPQPVRPCPQCGRPNGPKFAHCMYCSAELPAADDGENDDPGEVKTASVLDDLGAGALNLEDFAAQAIAALSPDGSARPPTTAPDPPPPVDGIEPGPEPALAAEPEPGSVVAAVPASVLEAMALAPPPRTTSLADELQRGRGPFGPRAAPIRLILLPSEAYAQEGDALRNRLAELLNIDLYTAGSNLRRAWPGCLAAPDSEERGRALLLSLRDAGLRVLWVEGSDWVMSRLPVSVASVEPAEPRGTWCFRGDDGASYQVRADDLSWAALGEIASDSIPQSVEQERNRWGIVERENRGSLNESRGPYVLLDLCRRSDLRPLRIRTDRFDFSCLGETRSLAAALNLKSLLQMLIPEGGALLTLDTTFRRVPHLPPGGGLARGDTANPALSREVEFTEYVLLRDAVHHDEG